MTNSCNDEKDTAPRRTSYESPGRADESDAERSGGDDALRKEELLKIPEEMSRDVATEKSRRVADSALKLLGELSHHTEPGEEESLESVLEELGNTVGEADDVPTTPAKAPSTLVDEAVSGIQAMPRDDPTQTRNSQQRQAGAFAVQRPRFIHDGGTSVTPMTVRNSNDDSSMDHLVEAQLVEGDVLHAEKVEDIPGSRKWFMLAVAIIVSVVIVTLVSLLAGKKASNDSATPQNGLMGTAGLGWANRTCFKTTEELHGAVNYYLGNTTASNSTVAQTYGWPIGSWCVHLLADFSNLFDLHQDDSFVVTEAAKNFHEPIGGWGVYKASHMNGMFRGMENVSAAWGIDQWDVSSVRSMKDTFAWTLWREPMLSLKSWDISRVRTLANMFHGSDVERPGVGTWDTSHVENLYGFAEDSSFNEDISGWNVHSVSSMQDTFRSAKQFNQDLSGWSTRRLKKLNYAFRDASSFNQDLSSWDVSRVITLFYAFESSGFNQDISSWHVERVTDMQSAFASSPFNQDISTWNVTSVMDLGSMFRGAKNFSQNLCSWRFLLSPDAITKDMFKGTACPVKSDPVIPEGPFCFTCDEPSKEERGQSCFISNEELTTAISAYQEDSSANSLVAKVYGWPVGSWCVSNIQDFSGVLTSGSDDLTPQAQVMLANFAEDIGDWDMSSARRADEMFRGAQNLSASLGIDRWNTSMIKTTVGMFMESSWWEPQLNLSSWETSKIISMAKMFSFSDVEQPGVASWKANSVQSMWQFAKGAVNFNEDISGWKTQRLTSIQAAFEEAHAFNQPIGRWKTTSMEKLNMAFEGATSFNQDLSTWDVSNVVTLMGTFKRSAFNQPINAWNVSKVTDLQLAFQHSAFNQDIGEWDVSRATDLRWAFDGAVNFQQDLCSWGSILPLSTDTTGMFKSTACPNTSDPIIPWGPFCFNCN